MPAPLRAWYTPAEIEALARRKASFQGEFTLAELTRLAGYLRSEDGLVRVRLQFETGGAGWQTLRLEYEAELNLPCQRCLEPFRFVIEDQVSFGIVAHASMQARLPEQLEPLALDEEDEERFSPVQLVEDELIVAVPYAPKHRSVEECGPSVMAALQQADAVDDQ
jgi:uncharacterized protein